MTDKAISPLRRRLLEDVAIRRLSAKTQLHYVRHVKRFADFLGRSADKATAEDVRRYQWWLASIGTTAPTANLSATALQFFFKVTLKRHDLAERLSWWSNGSPWFSVSQDGIEDGEKLSRAGSNGNFGWLAGGAQPLIGTAERQLVADGHHDRHEEGGAHRAAAAGDGASAAQGAAVAVEGSQPVKAGDFAAVEGAQFGEFRDQRAGDGIADRRHAGEQVLLVAPSRTTAASMSCSISVSWACKTARIRSTPRRTRGCVRCRRRLLSAPIISTIWRRRATSSPSVRASALGSGRGSGRAPPRQSGR